MIVEQRELQNGEEIIKQKILVEIDESKFTNTAAIFIPEFKFSVDYQKLTLKEIAFFWNIYFSNVLGNCRKCGNEHSDANSCPANSKQCTHCKDWNHYNRRCPTIFIFECKYCGSCHFNRKCPAFNETCSKCQRKNHFFWKCQGRNIVNCNNCNLTHPYSKKQFCPARNTTCTNCKQVGHFASKCRRRVR